MRVQQAGLIILVLAAGSWCLLRAQKPFRQYDTVEGHAESAIPPDANVPHEWTRARLMYRDSPYGRFGFRGGGSWTIDYPRSDRHLLYGVKRLTRIDARAVEQPVALDNSDDVYNWPTLYAVEVGHWDLNTEEAAQLRDFLLRGGFLMVDDFHGTLEWDIFVEGIKKVFPDREIVDLPKDDQIFHTLYDLDEKYQIPGAQYLRTGRTYEQDGYRAEWKGIYDDKGRVIVAICHNMDLGDAWEWSDEPEYPAEWANMAYRIAMDYFIYDFTH
jgi:Domain of unknown function (DUF4159)